MKILVGRRSAVNSGEDAQKMELQFGVSLACVTEIVRSREVVGGAKLCHLKLGSDILTVGSTALHVNSVTSSSTVFQYECSANNPKTGTKTVKNTTF